MIDNEGIYDEEVEEVYDEELEEDEYEFGDDYQYIEVDDDYNVGDILMVDGVEVRVDDLNPDESEYVDVDLMQYDEITRIYDAEPLTEQECSEILGYDITKILPPLKGVRRFTNPLNYPARPLDPEGLDILCLDDDYDSDEYQKIKEEIEMSNLNAKFKKFTPNEEKYIPTSRMTVPQEDEVKFINRDRKPKKKKDTCVSIENDPSTDILHEKVRKMQLRNASINNGVTVKNSFKEVKLTEELIREKVRKMQLRNAGVTETQVNEVKPTTKKMRFKKTVTDPKSIADMHNRVEKIVKDHLQKLEEDRKKERAGIYKTLELARQRIAREKAEAEAVGKKKMRFKKTVTDPKSIADMYDRVEKIVKKHLQKLEEAKKKERAGIYKTLELSRQRIAREKTEGDKKSNKVSFPNKLVNKTKAIIQDSFERTLSSCNEIFSTPISISV